MPPVTDIYTGYGELCQEWRTTGVYPKSGMFRSANEPTVAVGFSPEARPVMMIKLAVGEGTLKDSSPAKSGQHQ